MYLQSLELVGFKSFAQKTIFEFNRGVTAIVGPNGCGKSNVLDAIRWVLGEQSAKALRGGEMADVIFSGTESRQALGMAEVSLTFTQCEKDLGIEWNEVRITRRTFRDGRSEYFINKTSCRLRDIHLLFMDTGIGRNAYSIMEQGKLDQILSSRPEDRRTIFEEAAGITKYKTQKKEALRKLEHTDAHLLRATDIIKEVKRQMASLQRQAAKARRFQSLLNDLRTLDTHISYENYQKLLTEELQVRTELENCENSRAASEKEVESQETQLAEFRAQQEEKDLLITSQREQLQNFKNRIFSNEQRIETHGQRKTELTEFILRSEAEIESATSKLQTQKSQITETDQLIQNLLEELSHSQKELQEKEIVSRNMRELRISTERSLQSTSSEIHRLEGDTSRLRSDISSAENKRHAVEIRSKMLITEAELLQNNLEEVQKKGETLKAHIAASTTVLETARKEAEEAQLQVREAQKSRQQVENQLHSKNKACAEQESRLKVLSELDAAGEGFDKGTQVVLQGLDNPLFVKPALLGALASLIEVLPEHIPAVEAVLGSTLQTILLKDTSIAESILTTLSAKKLGRAALLSREWLPLSPVEEPLHLPPGALRWIFDSIQCSKELSLLLKHLLDQIALVPHLELAFQLKQQYPQYGFVTLAGEFISRTGIATGGSTQKAPPSTLLRKAQITELKKSLLLTHSESEALSITRQQAIETEESAQHFLSACRERVQQVQLENSQLQSEFNLEDRGKKNYTEKLANISKEIHQLETQQQQAEEHHTAVKTRLIEILKNLEIQKESENSLQKKLEESRHQEAFSSEKVQEIRIRVTADRHRQETLTQQRQPMTTRLVELTEILEKRSADISNYQQRILTLENELTELHAQIAHWQEKLHEYVTRLNELQIQRHQIHENIQALETTLRSLRKQLTDLQDIHGHLEVRSSQLKMQLEHLCDAVQKRYQITLSEFQPDSSTLLRALQERSSQDAPFSSQEEAHIPWPKIESLVRELTERVDSIGPVNLEAIQEYDELEQRHSFLEQQYNDLINSKQDLLEVISKINHTTQELFAETFEKIRINFQKMFVELFGGGRANLLLVDESDPLESGIEIIAKPPGKQLQIISLLSGGERTMTAVSLLFAIYMVKPSPFCVLDEMDAPLDESNINRFIKILDRFIEQSQFVVITHNKRTISRADMIYGVTMQEHGISKLVSVKFRSKISEMALPSITDTLGKNDQLQDTQKEELVEM